jgi:hypothetical protein
MVVTLVLCACSGGSSEPEAEVKKQPTMLDIYVYAPDKPVITRSDNGDVAADNVNEKKISSLHIWVFRHSDGVQMGYLNPDINSLNTNGNAKYQILMPEGFVTEKPNVDVYVMANVTNANCGLTALNKSVSRSDLEGILIGHKDASDYYGLTTLVKEAPDEGLPMSGVLKNQPVYGEAPVLRIGTSEHIATLQLVRAVSKMRFIFSKFENDTRVYTLTSVSLNGSTMPKQEYLFLDGAYPTYRFKVGSDYEAESTLIGTVNDNDINACVDPSEYAYVSGDGQEYETTINTAFSESKVSDLGRFYLRESDKKLTGKINYKVKEVENEVPKEATFSMKTDGDFSRNHTWIVYAYFMNGNLLNVNMVDVKSWTPYPGSHEVYNW